MAPGPGSRIPAAEIMTDILYRLPAKSLGRFRCVSKDWLSLISDQNFIKIHLKTLNQNHIIFCSYNYLFYTHPFHDHRHDAVLTPVVFLPNSRYVGNLTFRASLHGLFLTSKIATDKKSGFKTLVLLNPTTKESVELPNPRCDSFFKETKSMYGFGYDSLSDEYKVVIVTFFYYTRFVSRPADNIHVHVYSLKTNTWRRVIDFPYDHPYDHSYSPSVLVNGFIHWIIEKNSDRSRVIVAFSLADETFIELPSPNLCDDVDIMSKNDCTLFALGGKLAIFAESEIWLMNEYGKKESWRKILVHGFEETWMVKPVILNDYGKVLFANDDMMLVYDVKKETFSKIVYDGILKNFTVMGTYVESLVSPKFSITY